jgi:gliding motility-associated-like protein
MRNVKQSLKTYLLLFYTIIVCYSVSYTQKENNIWYFGFGNGIDFNGPFPVLIANGAINTNEACSSICDEYGNILFYTNGVDVWNKNHTLMPNGTGLLGNRSTTQTIIVKKPGPNTIFYIFTLDKENGMDGFSFSKVDISLQSGLGDVIFSSKNTKIDTSVCEGITAIRHSNNTDYWVITHSTNSNGFNSYLLNSSGLNITPIVSNIGRVISSGWNGENVVGNMKASPDGSKIALAGRNGMSELFNFNNSTGILSNPLSLTNIGNSYGVEFSPNNNLLYLSSTFGSTDEIFQYNLNAGSQTAIINSRTSVMQRNGTQIGALQLGPDNKIYEGANLNHSLGVINNPNLIGVSCNYISNGFSLNGNFSALGLPLSFPVVFPTTISSINLCFGDSTIFTYLSSKLIDSVLWDFNDTLSGINNFSSDSTPIHIFSSSGVFNVKLTIYTGNFYDTTITTVNIKQQPIFSLGNDTTLCENDTLILNAYFPNSSYLWQDNSIGSMYIVNQQGNYWAETNLNNCISKDSINITYKPTPIVNLGNDTTLCQNEILILNAHYSNSSYLWQDNSTDSMYIVNQQGNYWVEINLNNCLGYDTIKIEVCVSEFNDIIMNIPNAFSPNRDGENDLFTPINSKGIVSMKSSIYNRWGNKIFQTENPLINWDGEKHIDGVYYWIVNYVDINGKSNSLKGNVTLFR